MPSTAKVSRAIRRVGGLKERESGSPVSVSDCESNSLVSFRIIEARCRLKQ